MISLTAHHLNFNLKIIRTEKLGFNSGDIIIKELLVLISKEFRFLYNVYNMHSTYLINILDNKVIQVNKNMSSVCLHLCNF